MEASSYTTSAPPPPSLPYHAAVSPTPSSPSLPYTPAFSPSAPPPPPPSSFLLLPSPPPPSYDESEHQPEARVPPSGQWSGFFLQNGEKNFFTMHLSFSSSSKAVGGECTDKEGNPGLEAGALSDILGTWEAFGIQQHQQFMIKFEKHYRGGPSVNYEGYFTVDFKRILGSHSNGSGSFEMDLVEAKPEEQVGAAWVKHGLISKYS